jgi:hypothetical protein
MDVLTEKYDWDPVVAKAGGRLVVSVKSHFQEDHPLFDLFSRGRCNDSLMETWGSYPRSNISLKFLFCQNYVARLCNKAVKN